jgi:predicted MFS family arabinose efflux permease
MSLLRDRRFALLVAGQAVNGIGSWCALIALWGYAAYKFDAGPGQIALLSLGWSLPAALLGPLCGVPVDRFGPRKVLIAADLAAAVISVALAFSTSYMQLVVLGAVIGFARALADPAFSALAPRLVDDHQLLRANALLGAALQSSIAFGPLLAAGAISAWGPRGAFLIDSATYLVGIAVVIPLHLRPVQHDDPHVDTTNSLWHDLQQGLRVVRRRPAVRDLLALGMSVYLVWGAYAVIEPIYVRDILHRPPSTFALLQAVFGIFLLTNGLLVARFGDRITRVRTIVLAALASAAAAPVYVGTDSLAAAFAGIAVWGAATAWFIAPHRTLVQRATPMAAHGRVMALDSTLRSWGHVIALPSAALLLGAFGVRAAAFTFAAMPVLGVLLVRRRALSVEVGPGAEDAPRVDAGLVAVVPAD